MPDLRLAKLPDRTPVKISISVSPVLHAALVCYADLYRDTYGEAESIQDLIPYMLESFLENDRSFAKARKEKLVDDRRIEAVSPPRSVRKRRSETTEPASTAD